MIGSRNQAAFLRKVTLQLRGIKKREEWAIYFVVACLCLVISLLLFIDVAYTPAAKNSAVQGQPHITLHTATDVSTFTVLESSQDVVSGSESVAHNEATALPSVAVELAKKAVNDAGEWYFDEVQQDWRYKKSE